MVAMVRHDAQQLAIDVHVALGLEERSLPPRPSSPPPGALSDPANIHLSSAPSESLH